MRMYWSGSQHPRHQLVMLEHYPPHMWHSEKGKGCVEGQGAHGGKKRFEQGAHVGKECVEGQGAPGGKEYVVEKGRKGEDTWRECVVVIQLIVVEMEMLCVVGMELEGVHMVRVTVAEMGLQLMMDREIRPQCSSLESYSCAEGLLSQFHEWSEGLLQSLEILEVMGMSTGVL